MPCAMLSRISTSRGESGAKIGCASDAVDGQLAELLEDAAGDRRLGEDLVVDEVLAGADAPDDGDQVGRVDVLEDVRRGAGLDGVEQLVLVVVAGEHDDAGVRQLALQALGRLDAVRAPAGRGP